MRTAMTREQRVKRAEFVKEQPGLWFFLMYAGAFFSASVVNDLLRMFGIETQHGDEFRRYVLPLIGVFPMWFGMRLWARRITSEGTGGPNAPGQPPPVDTRFTLPYSESSPGSSYSGCP